MTTIETDPTTMTTATVDTRAVWRPSAEGARTLLLWLALAVAVIGAMALGLSFASVMTAAHPYFGTASFALPVIIDVAIFALTFTSIAMELNALSSPGARYAARALVALTVFANVAPQHTLYGRVIHGAPPVVWSITVMIAEHAIRQLVGLASDVEAMDRVRRSRWLLAPVSTFRLWRRMRLWEITSYRAAVEREHSKRASTALLREWHGPRWRRTAPSAQRLAVALQASTDRPVAELLTEAAEGIMAAANAARMPGDSASGNGSGTDSAADSETAPSGQVPARNRTGGRPKTGQLTADKVAKYAAKNPDATVDELAAKAKVSARTVRRYLAPARRYLAPARPTGSPIVEPVTHANGHATADGAR